MKIPMWSYLTVLGFGLAVFALAPGRSSAESATVVPAPAVDEKTSAAMETAVFAGGCCWGVQGVFQHVEGVKNAVSGYAGGAKENAEYGKVGSGRTGHAESV